MPASGHPREQQSRGTHRVRPGSTGVPVLDVIYLAATLALFTLVGLIAKGVEKL
ncbi:hypothetical protein [Microbacterium sp. P5_E9]